MSEAPVRILFSSERSNEAAHRVRITEPLSFLEKAGGFEILNLEEIILKHQKNGQFSFDNPDFQSIDIFYLFLTDVNLYNIDKIGAIINYLVHRGTKIVTNLDDHYFNLPKSITVKKELDKHKEIFTQLVKISHLVMVTGEYLKQEVAKINPRVVVVPNMIDPDMYPTRAGGNQRIHLGWCGLVSHFADLNMVLPAITRIVKEYEVDFTLFGLVMERMEDTLQQAQSLNLDEASINKHFKDADFITDAVHMARLLEGVPYRHVPLVTYEEYPQTLNTLNFDIGICPLLDNEFNRCKSAIKFAQYASVGTVTVASKVYPYSEECNYLAENTETDWYEKLKKIVEDKNLRLTLLKKQQEYINANRNYKSGIKLYQMLFRKLALKP